jgi:hypothetical protein
VLCGASEDGPSLPGSKFSVHKRGPERSFRPSRDICALPSLFGSSNLRLAPGLVARAGKSLDDIASRLVANVLSVATLETHALCNSGQQEVKGRKVPIHRFNRKLWSLRGT